MIALADVLEAAARLRGVAHVTPVLTSRTLDGLTGAAVHLKAECFQRSGSFKFRGAYNRLRGLHAGQRARGVVAYSSGNHGQAVALAARLLDTPAVIVMPDDAPRIKLAATRGYGAEVVTYNRRRQEREALGAALAAERGLTLVPPFDDPLVMAGQGTAALELVRAAGPLDALLVPVGGGGLIAGCATAAKALRPGVRVIGVEPASGDDTARSLAAGRRVRIPPPRTIADGQLSPVPGELTFEVNRRRVDEVALVSDEELLEAMALLFDRLKVVVEPSGAAAVAALISDQITIGGLRVGAVLSGGNVDFARLCGWMAGRRRPQVPTPF